MKKIEMNARKVKFYGFVVLMSLVCVGVVYMIFRPASGPAVNVEYSGLNKHLPGANVNKDSAKDKMSFYAVASADSLKRAEQMKMDPNRKDTVMPPAVMPVHYLNAMQYRRRSSTEDKDWVTKIKSLQQGIAATDERLKDVSVTKQNSVPVRAIETVVDPEMESINTTLDKLMALQHPEKMNKGKEATSALKVEAVEKETDTYFGKTKGQPVTGFYNRETSAAVSGQVITARILYEQVVQPGSTVRLELSSPVNINDIRIPVGTVLSGIVSIDAERLQIQITSIPFGNQLMTVALSVYDLDGLQGIHIPGSLSRDVAKQSAEGAVQSIGLGGFDASLTTQAISTGIGAAKNFLSKKVKAARVTLTAGYRVLLYNTHSSYNP